MRVAVLTGPGAIDVVQRPEPELLPGTVIVAVDRCGIGATDIQAFVSGSVPAPAWFGHEWVGHVVAVGAGSRDRFEGERVVGAAPPPCGQCRPCMAGLGPHCEVALAMIVGSHQSASPHGAFADRIRVDARRVHRVPDGVELSNAALAEPAAVAAHAVARAGQSLGDVVVVVGAGTIGLLVAELARLAGAARVAAVDIEPQRRELACELGADAAFGGDDVLGWLRGQGHGLGADVVYECAGRPSAVSLSIEAARQGGTVVVVGLSGDPGRVGAAELVHRQLTVTASLGYTVTDVHRALDLMADDRFRVSAIHDRRVGFGDLADTFAELASYSSARRKVLFAPGP